LLTAAAHSLLQVVMDGAASGQEQRLEQLRSKVLLLQGQLSQLPQQMSKMAEVASDMRQQLAEQEAKTSQLERARTEAEDAAGELRRQLEEAQQQALSALLQAEETEKLARELEATRRQLSDQLAAAREQAAGAQERAGEAESYRQQLEEVGAAARCLPAACLPHRCLLLRALHMPRARAQTAHACLLLACPQAWQALKVARGDGEALKLEASSAPAAMHCNVLPMFCFSAFSFGHQRCCCACGTYLPLPCTRLPDCLPRPVCCVAACR
jgi:hypothetical protein